jgi:aubergine-like protein
VLDYELGTMIDTMKAYEANYEPKILYIFVDKRINTRFFELDGQNIVNPAPGTVVDTSLVEDYKESAYDFYLIPHKATIATALPVHYRVDYNTTRLDKKAVEEYTY